MYSETPSHKVGCAQQYSIIKQWYTWEQAQANSSKLYEQVAQLSIISAITTFPPPSQIFLFCYSIGDTGLTMMPWMKFERDRFADSTVFYGVEVDSYSTMATFGGWSWRWWREILQLGELGVVHLVVHFVWKERSLGVWVILIHRQCLTDWLVWNLEGTWLENWWQRGWGKGYM